MTSRILTSSLFSRVSARLFGQPVDEGKLVAEALRELMAVESVLTEKPQLLTVSSPQGMVAKQEAFAAKLGKLSQVNDENTRFLTTMLQFFSPDERARIISDVSSHSMSDYQIHRYMSLLESVTDLGNKSGVFADPTFFDLVRGLKHGIKASPDSDLFGDADESVFDAAAFELDKLRVRFGLRLHIIAKTTYSEPLAYLFRGNVKEIGLVLRDPSLEAVLLRRPDRMEDIYDLLMVNFMTTGNRVASILSTEDRLIKNR
jgi:hypothetical protein